MRVVIVSRIFSPEPSAASFMLEAIAAAHRDAGDDVTVMTVKPPKRMATRELPGIRVKRAPVLRDVSGYVRGYLPYLSFDVPLFLRLLLSKKADLYIVEPPPTTGFVVRVAAALLRRPYLYDAADVWSDAASMATSSKLVLAVLRAVEVWVWKGASHVVTISEGVRNRMRELGSRSETTVTGFGVDTAAFVYSPPSKVRNPYFVYAGTFSEWHGAEVFVEAFARFSGRHPHFRLIFVGNGSEREALEELSQRLDVGAAVTFREAVDPHELSELLSGAHASLASLKPLQGYDYAFTTKLYSSIATGCPVIFSGVGPTADFIDAYAAEQPLGVAVNYDADAVAREMASYAALPLSAERRRALSAWAERFSLASIAERIRVIGQRVVDEQPVKKGR